MYTKVPLVVVVVLHRVHLMYEYESGTVSMIDRQIQENLETVKMRFFGGECKANREQGRKIYQ